MKPFASSFEALLRAAARDPAGHARWVAGGTGWDATMLGAAEVYAANTRLRDFLKTEYLPKARDGVGLMYMKGGDALYRFDVQSTTTLPMTPEQIAQGQKRAREFKPR